MQHLRLRFTRQDYLKLVLGLIAYIVPSSITISINWANITRANLESSVIFILLVGGISAAIVNVWAIQGFRAQLREETRRHGELAIEQTLELTARLLDYVGNSISNAPQYPWRRIRTNVMLIGPDGKLCVTYHYNMGEDPDRTICVAKEHGCSGRAWATGKQIVADLTIEEQDHGPTWGLTPEERKLTEHLKSILSSPIWHPDRPKECIGVMNVDSPEPLSITHLGNEDILTLANKAAAQCGVLLVLCELVQ